VPPDFTIFLFCFCYWRYFSTEYIPYLVFFIANKTSNGSLLSAFRMQIFTAQITHDTSRRFWPGIFTLRNVPSPKATTTTRQSEKSKKVTVRPLQRLWCVDKDYYSSKTLYTKSPQRKRVWSWWKRRDNLKVTKQERNFFLSVFQVKDKIVSKWFVSKIKSVEKKQCQKSSNLLKVEVYNGLIMLICLIHLCSYNI